MGKKKKKMIGTFFNDLHLLSMKFPSAGKQLSKIYIKYSGRISLMILYFWFTDE